MAHQQADGHHEDPVLLQEVAVVRRRRRLPLLRLLLLLLPLSLLLLLLRAGGRSGARATARCRRVAKRRACRTPISLSFGQAGWCVGHLCCAICAQSQGVTPGTGGGSLHSRDGFPHAWRGVLQYSARRLMHPCTIMRQGQSPNFSALHLPWLREKAGSSNMPDGGAGPQTRNWRASPCPNSPPRATCR